MYQEFYFLCFFNKVLFLVSFFYCKIRIRVSCLYFRGEMWQQAGTTVSLPHGGSIDTPAAEKTGKNLQSRHVAESEIRHHLTL